VERFLTYLKPIIVGHSLSSSGDGIVLGGRCGRRLSSLMSLTYKEYLRRFDRTNLFVVVRNRLDVPKAVVSSLRLPRRLLVIFLGRDVARMFGLGSLSFLEEYNYRDSCWVVAPHPSGLNRWYNDPKNLEMATYKLTELSDRWTS
jgi:hypothetical protein